ncbi:MAG: hypothetical protein WBA76_17650 [Phormidesmis sp.]
MLVTVSVICLNCLLAVLMCWLARALWRWRCAISRLTHQLQSYEPRASLMPRQTGYVLTRRRSQIAELRLGMAWGRAQWQMRSHQAKQLFQLVQLVRALQTGALQTRLSDRTITRRKHSPKA